MADHPHTIDRWDDATGENLIEQLADDDGGCYVTIFAGPAAERRARDYFSSLKSGRLIIQPEPLPQ